MLAGISGKIACDDIAEAESRGEKNEIFVEYAASTTTGVILGAAVATLLVTTPVGWGVALVLGAGTAAWSKLVGDGAGWFYDKGFKKYDLIGMTGVDKICN